MVYHHLQYWSGHLKGMYCSISYFRTHPYKCVYSKLQLPDLKESYLRIEKEKNTISASFQRGRSEDVKIDRTINPHAPNGNVWGYCSQIKWLKSGFRILQIALAGKIYNFDQFLRLQWYQTYEPTTQQSAWPTLVLSLVRRLRSGLPFACEGSESKDGPLTHPWICVKLCGQKTKSV